MRNDLWGVLDKLGDMAAEMATCQEKGLVAEHCRQLGTELLKLHQYTWVPSQRAMLAISMRRFLWKCIEHKAMFSPEFFDRLPEESVSARLIHLAHRLKATKDWDATDVRRKELQNICKNLIQATDTNNMGPLSEHDKVRLRRVFKKQA